MNTHKIYAAISPKFREERIRNFLEKMQPDENTRILDVGGYSGYWKNMGIKSHVTIVNLHDLEEDSLKGSDQFTFVKADGCDLPFDNNSFDLVYSNSVIEHLFTSEKQQEFASEANRVGKSYWIQTPAKEFPVEPHVLTPFIHWFPKKIQLRLAKYFTVRSWILDQSRPSRQSIYDLVDEVVLLNKRQIMELFPDGKLIIEKFLGFKKSFILYKSKEDQ
ncbi:MAG: class I SAM-dependent methyltransferase [Rubritalea sp.]